MKRKLFKILLTATSAMALGSAVSANAFDCCQDPCCWYAGVDAVLFEHCGGNNYYGLTGNFAGTIPPTSPLPNAATSPLTQRHICCKYKGGFRLFAGYRGCDCFEDIRLSWLYLDNSSKSTTNLDAQQFAVIPNIPNPNADSLVAGVGAGLNGRVRHALNVVDLDFRYTLHCNCCFKTQGIAGLRFFHLKRSLTASSFVTDGEAITIASLDDKNETWGLGPRVGFETTWSVCNFDILVGGGASFLAGTIKYTQRLTPIVNYDLKDESRCNCFPAFDARVELGYSCDMTSCCQSCCGCCCTNIDAYAAIGYEISKYIGAIQYSQFVNGTNTNKLTDEHDYGYQGFYLRFALNY